MSKLRIGLVGCGAWAREAHLPFLLSQDDVELLGLLTRLRNRDEKTFKLNTARAL
jgi:predicted dehydrogenase